MFKSKFTLGALALSIICAGCGGSGGNGTDLIQPPDIEAERTTPSVEGTATEAAAPPEGETAQITVNIDGTRVVVEIAGGEVIAPGDTVVVIAEEFPLDLTDDEEAPTATRAGGNKVYIDGKYTGIRVEFGNLKGTKSLSRFGLRRRNDRSMAIEVRGRIRMGSGSKRLTIQNGIFIRFNRFSRTSYPTSVKYSLPANGKFLSSAKATIKFNRATEIAKGTLRVESSAWRKQQRSYVTDFGGAATLTFSNLSAGKNDRVPTAGVQRVRLSVTTIDGEE